MKIEEIISNLYSKRTNLREATSVAGLMTEFPGKFNPNKPIMIRDPDNGTYISPDDFFAKYPDQNRQQWEKALATKLDPNRSASEKAEYDALYNDLSWMTPEEQAEFKRLHADDLARSKDQPRNFAGEKYLKKLFQQKADAKKAKSMIKVHWAPLRDLPKYLQGKISSRTELSAYMVPNVESLGKVRWGDDTVGIVLDGHITIAGRLDLGSDQYKTIDGVRGQQKYTTRPGQIDPTFNTINYNKHHEALVDNWKIKEIVLPADIPADVDDLIKQYNIPVRRLS